MDSSQVSSIIRLVWPLIALQIGLQIYCIIDILRRKKTKNLSIPIWIIIVLLGEIFGSILYLIIGRSEE